MWSYGDDGDGGDVMVSLMNTLYCGDDGDDGDDGDVMVGVVVWWWC